MGNKPLPLARPPFERLDDYGSAIGSALLDIHYLHTELLRLKGEVAMLENILYNLIKTTNLQRATASEDNTRPPTP